jgi:transposase InsO family protein
MMALILVSDNAVHYSVSVKCTRPMHFTGAVHLARRAAVRRLQRVPGVSERFASRVAGQHCATQRHHGALRAWLRQYAKDHPRRGFRPAYHDAHAERWMVNHKKIQRLWREEGLRVPQRRRRKRHGTFTAPPTVTADAPNRMWAARYAATCTHR